MSPHESLFPWAAGLLTGFFLVAVLFITTDEVLALEPAPNAAAPCTCPDGDKKSAKPKFAELTVELDEGDELAALESLQVALSEAADGASYVWHRDNGRLSGLIQPTSSFRNTRGNICRHLMVLFTTGLKTRKTEGVACRQDNGVWRLDG